MSYSRPYRTLEGRLGGGRREGREGREYSDHNYTVVRRRDSGRESGSGRESVRESTREIAREPCVDQVTTTRRAMIYCLLGHPFVHMVVCLVAFTFVCSVKHFLRIFNLGTLIKTYCYIYFF